jgi:hypothetical protein
MNKPDSMSVIISVIYSNALDYRVVEELLKNDRFLKKTLRLAEINGLYYYFMLKLREFGIEVPLQEERFNKELEKLSAFKETIRLLNTISRSIQSDYMIIKACTEIPHVPRDIDILVHESDKDKYSKAFENIGMTCVHSNDVETSFSKEGYLKVDIYTGVRYVTIDFLKDEYLWSSYKTGETAGVAHPLLGNEANILLMLVHSLYGHRSMTFLDFLHIARIMENSDINLARKYAFECGWGETFEAILNKFNEINESIIGGTSANMLFPYRFSPNFVMNSISHMEHLKLDRKTKMFLHFSFFIDRVLYDLRKSRVYDILLNYQWIRNSFNSFNYFVRHACGDDKSR